MSAELRHFLGKAQDALRGGYDAWGVMSSGERVSVAFVLNRSDWLAIMGYTMAEAVGRMDTAWLRLLPQVLRALDDEPPSPVRLNAHNWMEAGIEATGDNAELLREGHIRDN